MELVNDFRVPLPVATAWDLLTDPERIAPCMPGAQLLSVDGEDFHGAVKVKVGPIVAQYKGKATFQEKDVAAHRAVIKADGKESRGQGNASAVVTMVLTAEGDATAVHLTTDLTISGKAAQFGRGVLADVSSKLVTQFVRNLEADILASRDADPAETPASAPADAPNSEAQVSQPPSAGGAPPPAAASATIAPPAAPSGTTPVASTTPPATSQPGVVQPGVVQPGVVQSAVAQPGAATATSSAPAPLARPVVAAPAAEPVSLAGVVAWPLLKRTLPVIGAAALLAVVIWLIVRAA